MAQTSSISSDFSSYAGSAPGSIWVEIQQGRPRLLCRGGPWQTASKHPLPGKTLWGCQKSIATWQHFPSQHELILFGRVTLQCSHSCHDSDLCLEASFPRSQAFCVSGVQRHQLGPTPLPARPHLQSDKERDASLVSAWHMFFLPPTCHQYYNC